MFTTTVIYVAVAVAVTVHIFVFILFVFIVVVIVVAVDANHLNVARGSAANIAGSLMFITLALNKHKQIRN